MTAVITKLKSMRSSPGVLAVPVVIQTPTDPEVSEIIEKINEASKHGGSVNATMKRRHHSVGKALHKLGETLTLKRNTAAAIGLDTDISNRSNSSHRAGAAYEVPSSSPRGGTDEEWATTNAHVRSKSLARLASGPLLPPSRERSQEIFDLDIDGPGNEAKDATVRRAPTINLAHSAVSDDPVGLVPPPPDTRAAGVGEMSGSAPGEEVEAAVKDPLRGFGAIVRKVQHNKIVMAAVNRLSHASTTGQKKMSDADLLQLGLTAFEDARNKGREDVLGEIHFSGHSARVARTRTVKISQEPAEGENRATASAPTGSGLLGDSPTTREVQAFA